MLHGGQSSGRPRGAVRRARGAITGYPSLGVPPARCNGREPDERAGTRWFAAVDRCVPLVKALYRSYGHVNPTAGGHDDGRLSHPTRPQRHGARRHDRALEGPQALPVADRPGRAEPGVRRLRRLPRHRVEHLVLGRPDRDPRHRPRDRPDRRARPLQPARRRDRGAGAGPLLPLDHLPLPADPVRRLPRRDGRGRRLGRLRAPRRPAADDDRQDRAGHLDRLHRRHRHQHRPRARPQEGGQRALAVQDRAGAGLLRPLLHRAQPRPPRPRRDPGGPGQLRGWARTSTSSGPARSAAR